MCVCGCSHCVPMVLISGCREGEMCFDESIWSVPWQPGCREFCTCLKQPSKQGRGGQRIPKLKSKQWREGHRLLKISFRDGVVLSAGWLHINGWEYSQDSSSCFVWGVLLHLSTLSELLVKGTPCSPSPCFQISVSPPGRPTHKMP